MSLAVAGALLVCSVVPLALLVPLHECPVCRDGLGLKDPGFFNAAPPARCVRCAGSGRV